MLVEHAMRSPSARSTRPASGASVAGEQPDQRRLAAAVRPEEAEPRAGTEHEAHVVEDAALAEALGDVLGDDEPLACAARWR